MEINYDILLEYLSYKGQGSWEDFKSAVRNLNYDDYDIRTNEVCRAFSSLGHVEFLFNNKEKSFSIAPAGICLLKNSYKGVLCGYRTRKFLENLRFECEKFSIKYREKEQETAPTAIFIDFLTKENLVDFMQNNSLDLYFTKDFSTRLLKSLPSIEEIINNSETEAIDVKASNVYIFDIFKQETLPAKGRAVSNFNLYERRFFDRNEYFLFYEDNFHRIDRNYGICIVYSKLNRKFLKYKDNQLHTSIVPIPELIDRALTLSSGFNRYEKQYQRFIYDKISLETAELVRQKIGLSLEIKND